METPEIIYPFFIGYTTEAEALAKIASIDNYLRPTWTDGVTSTYAIPREDAAGIWQVIVEQHTEQYFTEEEKASKKYFEELTWPEPQSE